MTAKHSILPALVVAMALVCSAAQDVGSVLAGDKAKVAVPEPVLVGDRQPALSGDAMIRSVDELLAVPSERVNSACEPTCHGDYDFRGPRLPANHGMAAWLRLRLLLAVRVIASGP